jgi:hypothetical protein
LSSGNLKWYQVKYETCYTTIRVATSEILKSHDLLNICLDDSWLALGSIIALLPQRVGGNIGKYCSVRWTPILEFKSH